MIAAWLTLYECDQCFQLISVKSDAEFEAFEQTWHTGFHYDFCPVCRYQNAVQERILRDAQTVIRLARMTAEEQPDGEFIH